MRNVPFPFALVFVFSCVSTAWSAASGGWPLIVVRQSDLTDPAFLEKAIALHAAHPGSCDEIWFSASAPCCKPEVARRKLEESCVRWRKACDAAGIRLSVQQAITLGHGYCMLGKPGTQAAAGVFAPEEVRTFGEDAWMVGKDGKRMTWRRFCPSSPEVLAMTCDYAKLVLETARPSSYWPDDDLRLGYSTDLGCFCPRCRGKSQEDLLCAYLDALRRAADEVGATVRFGLQTVRPHVRDTVRDYRRMLETLSGGGRYAVAIRPGNGHYDETKPRNMIEKTICTAREAERCRGYGGLVGTVCYEEENYPRLALNKSPAAIVTECALALASGADTVSVYFAAGGERPDDIRDYATFVTCIADSRPYFLRLSESTKRTHLGGVVAGDNVAVAGIPVSVPESPAATPWPASLGSAKTPILRATFRRQALDALDAATDGRFPVRIDLTHALRILPRIDDRGKVDSVTVLNCSIGETFPFEMRVRGPAGEIAEIEFPRTAPRRVKLTRKDGETVVSFPSLAGWQIATVFFR